MAEWDLKLKLWQPQHPIAARDYLLFPRSGAPPPQHRQLRFILGDNDVGLEGGNEAVGKPLFALVGALGVGREDLKDDCGPFPPS